MHGVAKDTKRLLLAVLVLLAVTAGGAAAADAAPANGDTSSKETLVQTQRICWWTRC